MGLAFDKACTLWQPLTCGDASGSCTFYDNKALSNNILYLLLAVKCVSLVAMIFAVIVYRPPVTTATVDTMEVKFNADANEKVETQPNGQMTRSTDEAADLQIEGKTNCGFKPEDGSVTEISQM